MIKIYSSNLFSCEKKYIFETIFTDFLGVQYEIIETNTNHEIKIELPNSSSLLFKAEFFSFLNEKKFDSIKNIEVLFSVNDFTIENDIPILFGKDYISISDNKIECHIDIFTSSFFMLSRAEEYYSLAKDKHGRYKGVNSLAHKFKILDRPVVDEYVEMLWSMIKSLDASVTRELQYFSKFITCDLDWPHDVIRTSFKRTILKSAADLIYRRDIAESFTTCMNYIGHILKINPTDAYRESTDWIMDENEKAGNKVAFFVIPKVTSSNDEFISLDELSNLIKYIDSRGHEIGIHPGYNCFDNEDNFKESVQLLTEAMFKAEVTQKIKGGRMHFLRWSPFYTANLWEKFNLEYDSTLSFADISGFRCGTCKEFTMYDLVNRKPLKLKQRPLISMECTIISKRYENLGYSKAAFERFKYFKEITKKYNGTYTLLWHNNHLKTTKDKEFYKELIQ